MKRRPHAAARILDDVGMKTMHFRHGLSGIAAR
jgi:hypothetical protein